MSPSTPDPSDSPKPSHGAARDLLLEAAAKLFAERGPDRVSIREIAAAAGVRHGGVNYHFGSKDQLHLEVLRRFSPLAHQEGPPVEAMRARKTPAEARDLFAQVVAMLVRMSTESLDPIADELFHRELARPEGPREEMFREVVVPRHGAMTELIRQMCPHITDEQELRIAALNVISQVLFLRLARPMVLRLFGEDAYPEDLIERFARRIVATSLHGLLAEGTSEGDEAS